MKTGPTRGVTRIFTETGQLVLLPISVIHEMSPESARIKVSFGKVIKHVSGFKLISLMNWFK